MFLCPMAAFIHISEERKKKGKGRKGGEEREGEGWGRKLSSSLARLYSTLRCFEEKRREKGGELRGSGWVLLMLCSKLKFSNITGKKKRRGGGGGEKGQGYQARLGIFMTALVQKGKGKGKKKRKGGKWKGEEMRGRNIPSHVAFSCVSMVLLS